MTGRRTALYRLFRSDGGLLYIGIGYGPAVRIASHRRKPWGSDIDITRTAITWFDDRDGAETAELRAIRDEKPLHNIVTGDENGCARFLPGVDGEPRRGFRPNAAQEAKLVKIRQAWAEREAARGEYRRLLIACGEAGVPVLYLSRELGVERKTLYRQLGRSAT
ncbi:hypothetical protein ACFFX1_55555 [Dactylosporangium sucinum]|uniref:GIY-YIG domain-containing protein n=1 Tax=Dactylosporangium sucinum TaxID=1424081 RepID=A0A917U200_9ACTN|nr:hypothetical protein [Dactylosporangium sucinum]GGM52466.1 hypothetical protein GCM10007977_062530 [Dactylosporangium sucinum]